MALLKILRIIDDLPAFRQLDKWSAFNKLAHSKNYTVWSPHCGPHRVVHSASKTRTVKVTLFSRVWIESMAKAMALATRVRLQPAVTNLVLPVTKEAFSS